MSFIYRVTCATFASMEKIDDDIIKLHFEETLSQHGEMLTDLLREQIARRRIIKSGELEESIDYEVTDYKYGKMLQVSFVTYGRQVDRLGYKKIKHDLDLNSEIWGIKENRKKNTRWYAQYMYEEYYKLVSRLMYGLGEDEMKRLKHFLENKKKL